MSPAPLSPNKATVAVIVVALAAALLFQPDGTFAAEERLDFYEIDREIGRQLIDGKKDLIDWADRLSGIEPTTVREAIVKIDVCMRAGLDDEGARTLDHIDPRDVDNLIEGIFYSAKSTYHAYDLALATVETYASHIRHLSLDETFFRHFRDEGYTDHPWSDERFVAWLDARLKSVEAYRRLQEENVTGPNRIDRPSLKPEQIDSSIRFWRRVRWRQLAEMGKVKEELRQMAAAVRADPHNIKPAVDYLEAVGNLTYTDAESKPGDLDWMADVCQPQRATDMGTIASHLVSLDHARAAKRFYPRAIETEITDEEFETMAKRYETVSPDGRCPFSPDQIRLRLAIGLREQWADCLMTLGEIEQSRAVSAELAEMRRKHELPASAFTTRLPQTALPRQMIEAKRREEAEQGKDDPRYWLRKWQKLRQLHGGSEIRAKEEETLRKALSLCPISPHTTTKVPADTRQRLLAHLANSLVRADRREEAVAILLEEINKTPANSHSAQGAADSLVCWLPDYVDPDEPILWRWLANRTSWGRAAERLLQRMFKAAPDESVGKYIDRATQLALDTGADASRAATLGSLMQQMNQPARAIPLLRHAIDTTTNDFLCAETTSTLFESYLDLNDWRSAEATVDRARDQLEPRKAAKRLDRIAVEAAQHCNSDDALRIWRRAANFRVRNPLLVAKLTELGLGDRLREYYDEVRRRLPAAQIDAVY